MTEINSDNKTEGSIAERSSDAALTRQEFIKKVVKGAALTGGLVAAPAILDRFLVPKAYAATSSFTGCGNGKNGDATISNGNPDVVVVNAKRNDVSCSAAGDASTLCFNKFNGDANLNC